MAVDWLFSYLKIERFYKSVKIDRGGVKTVTCKVSKILKICAYVFLIGSIVQQGYSIAANTSYLNTGELMGVQSMLMMLWSCFISLLLSFVIYGFAEIVEYYELMKTKETDVLTNQNNDVK